MLSALMSKLRPPAQGQALPGRAAPLVTATTHYVNGRALKGPYPQGIESAIFGMGCFWGGERKFWQAGKGVYVTAVGYAGGATPNPTYEETCSGRTGHARRWLAFELSRDCLATSAFRFLNGDNTHSEMRQLYDRIESGQTVDPTAVFRLT